MRVWVRVGMGALAAVVALSGCGQAGPPLTFPGQLSVGDQASTSTAAAAGAPASKQPSAGPRPQPTASGAPRLGTAVNVTGPGGALASVAAAALVDPATPAYFYDAAGTGQRFVAVKMQITDTGPTMLQENALNDTSIVDSTGATQTPVVTELAGCAAFLGGEFSLAPHSSEADTCVTFELATTSTIKAVHFVLGRDTAGQGVWSLS
ncbi:MAG: hypothetical protein M3137_11450 [Actinomycetota bacterium]|nr:hypothetical protein [Actinomycetota bacterium]